MQKIFLIILFITTSLYSITQKDHPTYILIEKLKEQTKAISAKKLKYLIDNFEDVVLLDVREILERSEGEIFAEESYALTRGDLEFHILAHIHDTDTRVVVYCRGGTRGIFAAHRMQELGYTNVYYLKGGLRAWANEGYPIETSFGITRLQIKK
jgi:phage shock protein E